MNKPTEGRSKSVVVVCVMLLVVLPVLYLLSVGPAIWLQSQGYLSDSTETMLEIFYFPLGWLSTKVEFFNDLLLWYVDLFV